MVTMTQIYQLFLLNTSPSVTVAWSRHEARQLTVSLGKRLSRNNKIILLFNFKIFNITLIPMAMFTVYMMNHNLEE